MPCPLCRRDFAAHLAVRALASARWRGASFDAAQAKANVGLAVADALGVSPRDTPGLERFTRDVLVEAYREARPAVDEAADPRSEPEWWEFHVGFREAPPPEVLRSVAEAAIRAVDGTRGYSRAGLVAAGTP